MLYVNPLEARSTTMAGAYRAGGVRGDKVHGSDKVAGDTKAAGGEAAGAVKETKALKEYEHLFVFQLLREMRKTVPKDSLFGKSGEQDYMEEMLDDHYAGLMAESGQFGIAKQMEAQMHALRRPEEFKKVELKPISTVKRLS